MEKENNCICCLESIYNKSEYVSCILCKNTFIDSECLEILKKTRNLCPVCNKIDLSCFIVTKNNTPVEINIDIIQKSVCEECNEEFDDFNTHLKNCKVIQCQFCDLQEKAENKEEFYSNHITKCNDNQEIQNLLSCNKMFHISNKTFYKNLRKGQFVDAFLRISSTSPDKNGLYQKYYLFDSNNKPFAFAIEAMITEITEENITVLDIWFQRRIILPKQFIYYMAPQNTYIPEWRNLLNPNITTNTIWFEKIKYKLIEKIEVSSRSNSMIELNISLGQIINISSDDPNMLLIDFGSNGITYVSRNSTNIRPIGIEEEITESLQIVYNLLTQ